MIKRLCMLATLLVIAGCGGGHAPSTRLLQFTPGMKWNYSFTGFVKLPESLGGGSQNVKSTSKFTITVLPTTTKDAHNDTVNIIDRYFVLDLLDGRQIKAHFYLYTSQTDLGLFAHGYNRFTGDTVDPLQDTFVQESANPSLKFLYIPNPVAGTVGYADPFGLTGDHKAFNFTINNSVFQQYAIENGIMLGMKGEITEGFDQFAITNAGINPDSGILGGSVNATLKDLTEISGTVLLIQ